MLHKENTLKIIITALVVSSMLCWMLLPSGTYAIAETTEPMITFDLANGTVEIGVTEAESYIYRGYDSAGTLVTGIHNDSNKYLVMQSDSTTVTENRIILIGNSAMPVYDVTISGINCNSADNRIVGGIFADAATPMTIIIRLQGDNKIGRLHYATNLTSTSSLLITSAAGDGSTEGSLTAYSTTSWSAAIGGIDDTTQEHSRNITIAGGTISARVKATVTDHQTGTSAIGGGGNGYSDVTITGGNITAINCGTGATIGGGGGRGMSGGIGYVTISGGTVNATNSYVNGVAIGGGGSIDDRGNATTVIISGGTVNATGGIGGGYSENGQGGNATVEISGGVVNVEGALGISGGSSPNGNGGTINVNITGGTVTADTISGGVGSTGTAAGTLSVTGGSVKITELSEQTSATNGTDTITPRAITLPNISEVTLVTNLLITEADGTTPYPYTSDIYTDETGTIYLWIPEDCIVKTVTSLENGEEQTNTITTNSPTYTIVIPNTVSISGSSGSFEVVGIRSNSLPSDTLSVAITTTSGFRLSCGEQVLEYELHSQGGSSITSGMEIATFVGNGTLTEKIYYGLVDTPRYAGTYTDTLTFTVSSNNGQE